MHAYVGASGGVFSPLDECFFLFFFVVVRGALFFFSFDMPWKKNGGNFTSLYTMRILSKFVFVVFVYTKYFFCFCTIHIKCAHTHRDVCKVMNIKAKRKKKSQSKQTIKAIARLTRFEYAKLLGDRALEIQKGGKLMFEPDVMIKAGVKLEDPREIAKYELLNKRCPMIVVRTFPGNRSVEIDPNLFAIPEY